MIKEVLAVRQNEGERRRRWFTDSFWDLYVWFENDGEIYGFQLCYGKEEKEHALSWFRDKSSYHALVDTGREKYLAGNLQSSLIIPDGPFDKHTVAGRFLADSRELDDKIRAFVYRHLLLHENE